MSPQESVLQPQDEANGNKSASLAASLSATVAGRARYFEELSRRRVLRLGIEADLREARAKLEILLPNVPPVSQRSDPVKGEEEHTVGRIEEKEGKGQIQPRHGDNSDDATQEKAGGDCEGEGKGSRDPKRQQDVCRSPTTNVASSKKPEVFGAPAKGGGISSQEPKPRVGRSRGTDVIVVDAPATPSANKRRCRAPRETATTHKEPPETIARGRRSAKEDTETANGPTPSIIKKKTGSARRQTSIALQEKHSKQLKSTSSTVHETDIATQDTAIDDPTNASVVEGELQEQDEAVVTGRVEQPRDEECHTAKECASESFTVESPPCEATGEEASSDHRGGKTSGKAVTKTGVDTKTKSLPCSVRHALAPRSSQRRPKGFPSPATQLRKPSKPPRGGLPNDSGTTDQSKAERDSSTVGDSQPKDVDDVGADDTIGNRHLDAANNVSGEEGVIHELVADAAESPGQEKMARAPDAEGRHNTRTQKKAEQRTKVASKLLRGQAVRDPIAQKSSSRPLGKTAKVKPALRAAKTPPTRLGIITKAKRALVASSDKDMAGSTPERVSPDHVAAAEVAEDVQNPEAFEPEHPLGESGVGSAARDSMEKDEAVRDEGAAEGGTVRGNIADKENGHVPTTIESTKNEVVCLEMHHAPTSVPTQDADADGGDCNDDLCSEEAGERPTDCCGGRVGVVSQPTGVGDNGSDDNLLPRDATDLAEALRGEVDRLRLERAELEDTVAQLNVAVAQLYFVEYEQMKVHDGIGSLWEASPDASQNTRTALEHG